MERLRNIFRLRRTSSSDPKTPKRTPLPKAVVAACLAGLFPSAFISTFLFPFLPWMVKKFTVNGEKITDLNSGPYVGFVASSLFLGRVFGSYFWGLIADKYGRRPAMLVSMAMLAATMLMFGFSGATLGLGWAVGTRFLTGLVNGVVGTAKAVLSEVCDNTNQAQGLTFLTASYGVGLVFGPALGGILAEPARQYPGTFGDSAFLKNFPYCLPTFVAVFICLVGLVIMFKYLPETLKRKKPYGRVTSVDNDDADVGDDDDDDVAGQGSTLRAVQNGTSGQHSVLSGGPRIAFKRTPHTVGTTSSEDSVSVHINHAATEMCEEDVEDARQSLLQTDTSAADRPEENSTGGERHGTSLGSVARGDIGKLGSGSEVDMEGGGCPGSAVSSDNDDEEEEGEDADGELAALHALALQQQSRWACWRFLLRFETVRKFDRSKLMYLLRRPTTRNTVLLYSIYSFGAIGVDELYSLWCSEPTYLGGLGMSLSKVGESLAIIGACQLPLQIFIVPKIERRLGCRRAFAYGSMPMVFATVMLPCLSSMANLPGVYPTLILVMLVQKFFFGLLFVCSIMMINNSVESKDLGSVNGLAMSCTAVLRSLAPILLGSAFTWSIQEGRVFPFNYNFIFILLGFVFTCTGIASIYLPESADRKYGT